MPVEYKDYYQILQVTREASPEEIRKAFRRFAREFHPDVALDKEHAEIRFKEINEAYEVLGDVEKRSTYDSYCRGWRPDPTFADVRASDSRESSPATGKAHQGTTFEFKFGESGFSEFFEVLFGAGRSRGDTAPKEKSEPPPEDYSRPGEDVESDLFVSLEEVLHGSIRPVALHRKIRCQLCYGTGQCNNAACPDCHGERQVSRHDKYQVRIPSGVRPGQRLRLPGQGDAAPGRGKAGDLLLRVRFSKHPIFEVEGANLICDLDVMPWEAVLGSQISVATLDGRVNVRVPRGSQAGQRLRVRDHGLPQPDGSRGDLHVRLRVRLPTDLSERERALWVQLAAEAAGKGRSTETAAA